MAAVLDPDVVLRADAGTDGVRVLRGAPAVARNAAAFRRLAASCVTRHVLVDGAAGLLNTMDGEPVSVMGFVVAGGKIVAIHILADPERLAHLAAG
ncbi:hypothetical protein ACQP1W_48395 [Spirillospora sp. CA-255316]